MVTPTGVARPGISMRNSWPNQTTTTPSAQFARSASHNHSLGRDSFVSCNRHRYRADVQLGYWSLAIVMHMNRGSR
jgi:hypothetical protein